MFLAVGLASLRLVAGDNPRCWNDQVNFKTCCDLSLGPTGNDACWEVGYTFENCCGTADPAKGNEALARLAAQDASQGFPACIEQDVILRHDGNYGAFADLSFYGHRGCFERNCSYTDKFIVETEDPSICARACFDVAECTHWTYGVQEGIYKCFLRNSAAGGALGVGWKSGGKTCGPQPIGPGFMALTFTRSAGLKACDNLQKDKCPDVHMAITTWAFLLKNLVKASEGRLDQASMQYVQNIHDATMKCLQGVFLPYDPTISDYRTCEVGEVVYNNRQIVNQLTGWLEAHPKIEVSETDISLPNPMRTGQLCGRTSCYEKVEEHLARLAAENEKASRKQKVTAAQLLSGVAEGTVNEAGDVALDNVGAEAAAAAKEAEAAAKEAAAGAAAAAADLAPQQAAAAATSPAPESVTEAASTSEIEVGENAGLEAASEAAKAAAVAAAAAGAADATQAAEEAAAQTAPS